MHLNVVGDMNPVSDKFNVLIWLVCKKSQRVCISSSVSWWQPLKSKWQTVLGSDRRSPFKSKFGSSVSVDFQQTSFKGKEVREGVKRRNFFLGGASLFFTILCFARTNLWFWDRTKTHSESLTRDFFELLSCLSISLRLSIGGYDDLIWHNESFLSIPCRNVLLRKKTDKAGRWWVLKYLFFEIKCCCGFRISNFGYVRHLPTSLSIYLYVDGHT